MILATIRSFRFRFNRTFDMFLTLGNLDLILDLRSNFRIAFNRFSPMILLYVTPKRIGT
jgi:hypothetical protein